VAVVGVATVIIVFCLMSTKALLAQASYQRRVINARHQGLHQLQANVAAANQLVTQYNQVFEGDDPVNIIGGQNTKDATAIPPNGDNARIVLDALPSKYDFPALLTSVNYILNKNNAQNVAIAGTDNTATANNSASNNPQPIQIQLTVSGTASYAQVQSIIGDFERSIRPFNVTSVQLSGSESNMSFTFALTTYYQQAKSLELTTKEVK
jgi:hypothetical protein